MGWTPLFLEMRGKKVLIIGAGEVGERRALRFLEASAEVIVTGDILSTRLQEAGAISGSINEIESLVDWADLIVLASGDHSLNQKVAEINPNKLINRADAPEKSNVIVPSSFSIGDVQICIYTQGKSPLMARELRKKIEKVISPRDVLQLELQHHTREILKNNVDGQKARRKILYQILNDAKINELLENGELEIAKKKVASLLEQKTKN